MFAAVRERCSARKDLFRLHAQAWMEGRRKGDAPRRIMGSSSAPRCVAAEPEAEGSRRCSKKRRGASRKKASSAAQAKAKAKPTRPARAAAAGEERRGRKQARKARRVLDSALPERGADEGASARRLLGILGLREHNNNVRAGDAGRAEGGLAGGICGLPRGMRAAEWLQRRGSYDSASHASASDEESLQSCRSRFGGSVAVSLDAAPRVSISRDPARAAAAMNSSGTLTCPHLHLALSARGADAGAYPGARPAAVRTIYSARGRESFVMCAQCDARRAEGPASRHDRHVEPWRWEDAPPLQHARVQDAHGSGGRAPHCTADVAGDATDDAAGDVAGDATSGGAWPDVNDGLDATHTELEAADASDRILPTRPPPPRPPPKYSSSSTVSPGSAFDAISQEMLRRREVVLTLSRRLKDVRQGGQSGGDSSRSSNVDSAPSETRSDASARNDEPTFVAERWATRAAEPLPKLKIKPAGAHHARELERDVHSQGTDGAFSERSHRKPPASLPDRPSAPQSARSAGAFSERSDAEPPASSSCRPTVPPSARSPGADLQTVSTVDQASERLRRGAAAEMSLVEKLEHMMMANEGVRYEAEQRATRPWSSQPEGGVPRRAPRAAPLPQDIEERVQRAIMGYSR